MDRTFKIASLVLTVILAAGAIGATVSKSVAKDVYEGRVTRSETRQDAIDARLDRMERKIDSILERVK